MQNKFYSNAYKSSVEIQAKLKNMKVKRNMNAYEKNLDKLSKTILKIINKEKCFEGILAKTKAILQVSNIKLYKYFYLEKFSVNESRGVTVSLDVDNLKFDTIFFNSFDNMNDPLENIQLKELEEVQSKNFNETQKIYLPNPSTGTIEPFPSKRPGVNVFNRNISLSCFSTNNPKSKESMLMWSHYAKNHQGLCYEYKVQDLISHDDLCKNIAYLLPVKYVSQINPDKLVNLHREIFEKYHDEIMNSYSNPGFLDKITKEHYITPFLLSIIEKYSDSWKYENEWRLVHKNKGAKLEDIHPTNIYAGAKMPSADFAKINQRCMVELGKPLIKANINDFLKE